MDIIFVNYKDLSFVYPNVMYGHVVDRTLFVFDSKGMEEISIDNISFNPQSGALNRVICDIGDGTSYLGQSCGIERYQTYLPDLTFKSKKTLTIFRNWLEYCKNLSEGINEGVSEGIKVDVEEIRIPAGEMFYSLK